MFVRKLLVKVSRPLTKRKNEWLTRQSWMGNAHQHPSDFIINVGMVFLPIFQSTLTRLPGWFHQKKGRDLPDVSRSPPTGLNEDPHANPLSQEQISWEIFGEASRNFKEDCKMTFQGHAEVLSHSSWERRDRILSWVWKMNLDPWNPKQYRFIQHVFQQTLPTKEKHAYLSHTLMPCHHVGVQASQKYPSRLHSAHQGNDRWSRLTNRNSSWLRLERSVLPSCSFENKQLDLPSEHQKWGLKKEFTTKIPECGFIQNPYIEWVCEGFQLPRKDPTKFTLDKQTALLHSLTWSSSF